MGVVEWEVPVVVVEVPPERMLEATDETLMRTGGKAGGVVGEAVVGGETLKGDARNRMVQDAGSLREGEGEGKENLMVGAGGSVEGSVEGWVAEARMLAETVPQMLKMRVISHLWFETE